MREYQVKKVQKITAYRASDGTLFEGERLAESHNAGELFRRHVDSNPIEAEHGSDILVHVKGKPLVKWIRYTGLHHLLRFLVLEYPDDFEKYWLAYSEQNKGRKK